MSSSEIDIIPQKISVMKPGNKRNLLALEDLRGFMSSEAEQTLINFINVNAYYKWLR